MTGPMRYQIVGFAADVLGATLDDLARVTAERDRLATENAELRARLGRESVWHGTHHTDAPRPVQPGTVRTAAGT